MVVAAGWFAVGSGEVNALVAQVTGGGDVVEQGVESCLGERGPVVGLPGVGRDGEELAVEVGEDLDVDAGFVAFAG